MSIKRLTKDDIRRSSGILNPVGHTVLAFRDESVSARAVDDLRRDGFAAADILVYTAEEATERLRERVRTASQSAGFGHEITLMRRYLALAEAGAGWLVVYTPDDGTTQRVTDLATRLEAQCAVRYHRLASEDLI